MPGVLADSFPFAEAVTLALAGFGLLVAGILAYRSWKRSLITPTERERLRRAHIAATGKMGDASLMEVRDNLLFYSYDVRGVKYTASQDIAALKQYMPADLTVAIGPVLVKYDPRNPANSAVLSEEWSGLRATFLQG